MAIMLTSALIGGCAQQQIRDTAETQFRNGDYEQALQSLQAGVQTYPDSALLRAGLAKVRSDVATRLLSQASSARAEGRLDDVEQSLRRASALQPGDARIDAMLRQVVLDRRQRALIEEANALVSQRQVDEALKLVAEGLKNNPRQSELLALKRRLETEQRQRQVQAAQLGLAETRPISLDFRDANLRTVLDVVSRNSGLNFILDKDIRTDAVITVFLRSAKVEDAVDLIVSTNQLAKKVIDSKTVLIYPNTVEKQREHQEQIVRVFYLASADAKGAAAFLKSMLKIRDPYIDERSNMLALRESEQNMQMAERLLMLYDTAEPEVLLEVEVIEINTTRLTELGVKFPDTFSLTPLPPPGEDRLTLGNIRGLSSDRIGLSIGGVTVNLRRETGDFNILASPRIRVKSKEKAHILVGDKIPIVTTTQGSTGFVSDSVTYIDVGLKLDVEPTVYVDEEVAIKVGLEVSSLGSVVKTASGTQAYQIGTRNASTLLRLRDGETQLLAGLISSTDRSDASKVPGLGDLPVAGRLFSSQLDNVQKVELVLSITPRILRNLRQPEVSEAEIWVGTEAQPRLRPVGGIAVARDVPRLDGSAGGAPSPSGTQVRANVAPVVEGMTADAAMLQAPAKTPVRPSVQVQLNGPDQVKVGEVFEVTLALQTDQPLRGVPVQMSYNKERLELLDIEEADLFKQGGAQTSFSKTIDGSGSRASAGVLRNSATGALGKGDVLRLRFKARSAGSAEIALVSARPVGLAGPIPEPTAMPRVSLQIHP